MVSNFAKFFSSPEAVLKSKSGLGAKAVDELLALAA